MLSLFGFGQKKIVTVDLGNHTVKVAQFSIKKDTPVLDKFVYFPVPKDGFMEDGLFNIERLSPSLSQFIKKNMEGISYNLRVCVSGKFVFVKKIEIPNEEKKLMRELIHMEAKEILPFHLSEVNYNYKILDHIQATEESKMSVLLVAAKKNAIYNYESLFKKIGLKCECIEIGGVALAHCVQFMESDDKNDDNDSVVLVVDIGKLGTELSVINKGELIFSRYFMVGGDFYNNALMQEMGISYEEAEKLKISSSEDQTLHPEVYHLVGSSHEYFCDELLSRYEYFKKQFPHQKLSKCYVTGGGSRMKSLIEAIGKKINASIQILDPLKKMGYSTTLKDSIDQVKYLCPLTVGLCLRGGK